MYSCCTLSYSNIIRILRMIKILIIVYSYQTVFKKIIWRTIKLIVSNKWTVKKQCSSCLGSSIQWREIIAEIQFKNKLTTDKKLRPNISRQQEQYSSSALICTVINHRNGQSYLPNWQSPSRYYTIHERSKPETVQLSKQGVWEKLRTFTILSHQGFIANDFHPTRLSEP